MEYCTQEKEQNSEWILLERALTQMLINFRVLFLDRPSRKDGLLAVLYVVLFWIAAVWSFNLLVCTISVVEFPIVFKCTEVNKCPKINM